MVRANNIRVREPSYYDRNYSNDLGKTEHDQTWFDQSKRVAKAALPFVSLSPSISRPLSAGMGAARVVSTGYNLYVSIKNGANTKETSYEVIQTTIAVIALAGTLFAHPVGMLITTGQDMLVEVANLAKHINDKDVQKALESCAKIINDALYLGMFFSGSLELSIASLAMQIMLNLYHSQNEFKQGHYIEGTGHFLMSLVRSRQLIGQAESLQKKWEAKKLWRQERLHHRKERAEEMQRMKTELQKQKEILEKNISELEKNKEALQESQAKINTLKTELANTQDLQDILIKCGNNPQGLVALHYAIQIGNKEYVQRLLEHGADVDSRNDGFTTLHRAVMAVQKEIAGQLLDKGANVHAKKANNPCLGWQAIHFAAQRGDPEMINLLASRGADVSANIHSLNPQYLQWETPLHIAVRNARFEPVQALVNRGALVDRPANLSNGREIPEAPLDVAVNSGYKFSDNPEIFDIVRLLVERGAQRKVLRYDTVLCPVIRGYLQSMNR